MTINPETIARFFREEEGRFQPARELFFTEGLNRIYCCGLTAALIEKDIKPPFRLESLGTEEGSRRIAELLGLDPVYALGFARGWDQGEHHAEEDVGGEDDTTYWDGYEDGEIAYEAAVEAVREFA